MNRFHRVWCRLLLVGMSLWLAATAQAASVAHTAVVQSLGLLPETADGEVLTWVGAVAADGEPLPPLLVFAGLVHAKQAQPHQRSEATNPAAAKAPLNGAYLTIVSSRGQLLGQHRFATGQYQGFAVARLAKPANSKAAPGQPAAPTRQQTQTSLVLLGADGVWALPAQFGAPAAAGPTALFQCPHIYAAMDVDFFAPLPLVMDANADGLDDFFLPGLQTHCLALQQSDGTFTLQSLQQRLPVTLLMPPFERAQLSFELAPLPLVVDLNGDGRTDLLQGSNAAVGYFLQQSDGSFDSVAQPLPLPVTLAGSERQIRQFKQLSRYQFERFADINRDGVPDLLLKHQQYGEDLQDSVAQLKVWYGAFAGVDPTVLPAATVQDAAAGRADSASVQAGSLPTSPVAQTSAAVQLSFTGRPAVLDLPGELVSLQFADFNGDKLLDASLLSAELGAGSLMSALMGNGVALDIRLYPQQADGRFAKRAVASYQTTYTVDVANTNIGVLFSTAYFNADSAADLLFLNAQQQLQLMQGNGNTRLSSKPQRLQAELPDRLQWISVLDVEQDGIAELLLRHLQPNGQLALQLVRFMSAD